METVIGLILIAIATGLSLTIIRTAQASIRSFDHDAHEMYGADRLEGIDE
jgi:hypothetical protein